MNTTQYTNTLYIGMDDGHSQYRRCRDGCRSSLLRVVCADVTSDPRHPYIERLPTLNNFVLRSQPPHKAVLRWSH